MKPRGEHKQRRSLEAIAAALGEDAQGTNPDEVGVFEIYLEADDLDEARQRALNAVDAAGSGDHVMLLETDDLPEQWHTRSGKPRAKPTPAE
ncbi:MAG: hypothetical protein QOE11_2841 [Solirubrobacteraceae bacterium]|nr:hypothetical protein [Solirubrobacteraceae bacterium]